MNQVNSKEGQSASLPRDKNGQETKASTRNWVLALLSLSLLLTFLAYSPALFDFFVGDDYVHLIWLKDAVVHPELIWRNFYTSWLDGTTTKFYRPLISVFMVLDYIIWNRNGTGFHLTNILFHLTSCVFIFLIAREMAREAFLKGTSLEDQPMKDQPPKEQPPTAQLPKKQIQEKTYESAVEFIPEIDRDRANSPQTLSLTLWWPFMASAIFGLYPLHTETVSWITGRVDSIVTAFITAGFYFHLKSRASGGKNYLYPGCALLSLILGLLSKEMAITLPAVLFLYELVFPRTPHALISISRVMQALKNTLAYFLVLVAYFGVRYMALGTFVGGYDDSLSFIPDIKAFIKTWLNGLRLFFEPLNHEILSARAPLTRAWNIILALLAASGLVNLLALKKCRQVYFFLMGWLVLSLLPVYKIFAIADDLQGSRLAYLATVPLAFTLSLSLILVAKAGSRLWQGEQAFKIALSLAVLAVNYVALSMNNDIWVQAGREANAIRASLDKLYAKLEGDPQILFVGLPDQIHGAYICRNALPGMTRQPQLQRDVVNGLMVDRFEPIMPFGHIKKSLYDNREKLFIYRWDSARKDFEEVSLKALSSYPQTQTYQIPATTFKEILRPLNGTDSQTKQCQFEFLENGLLKIQGGNGRFGRPEIEIELAPLKKSFPCFALEFVTIKLDLQKVDASFIEFARREGGDLLYKNSLTGDFDLRKRTHCAISLTSPASASPKQTADSSVPPEKTSVPTELTLHFPLHSLPEWALGGQAKGFILKLPHNTCATIKEITFTPYEQLLPQLEFANSGYLGSKGYLHLSKAVPTATLNYDASKLDADSVEVEVSRTNLLFEEQNCTQLSRVAKPPFKIAGNKGTIPLKLTDFRGPGIYELRIWPLNSQTGQRGLASDHIVVAVD